MKIDFSSKTIVLGHEVRAFDDDGDIVDTKMGGFLVGQFLAGDPACNSTDEVCDTCFDAGGLGDVESNGGFGTEFNLCALPGEGSSRSEFDRGIRVFTGFDVLVQIERLAQMQSKRAGIDGSHAIDTTRCSGDSGGGLRAVGFGIGCFDLEITVEIGVKNFCVYRSDLGFVVVDDRGLLS